MQTTFSSEGGPPLPEALNSATCRWEMKNDKWKLIVFTAVLHAFVKLCNASLWDITAFLRSNTAVSRFSFHISVVPVLDGAWACAYYLTTIFWGILALN